MKLITIALLTLFINSKPIPWLKDFDKAKTIAISKQQRILLNFSGSDWCLKCIEMHKEIFSTDTFITYATNNLVLVNANFPRLKKNKLPKAELKQNEKLAEKYNPDGIFPLTVLLSADGAVLKKWLGMPKLKSTDFINEIKSIK